MNARPDLSTTDPAYNQIHELVTATLEDPGCPQAEQLRELLDSGGQEIRAVYTAYMAETEALRTAGIAGSDGGSDGQAFGGQVAADRSADAAGDGQFAVQPTSASKSDRAPLGRTEIWSLAGAALAAGLLLAFILNGGRLTSRPGQPTDAVAALATSDDNVATLTRLIAVEWETDAEPLKEMSRLGPGQRLAIRDGQIEIVFDTGVELVVAGRAHAEIDSHNRVIGRLGAYSARVSERGKGFIIDTPTTRVVDLGTEFGVAIADTGDTEVAVFEGMVDLDDLPDRVAPLRGPERLAQGEAVKIDPLGNQTRLMAITSERFPTAGRRTESRSPDEPLISAVGDNLRDPSNKKFYRLVRSGLYEDVCAFVDRSYEWNGIDEDGIPQFLRGAEYLMPFNDDKVRSGFSLAVSVSAPCTVYVFYSNKMPTPSWLADGYEDTGYDLGLDRQARTPASRKRLGIGAGKSIDETFSIWRRDLLVAGDVTMGNAVQPVDGERGWNMYGVAVTGLAAPMATVAR